ncbi:inositol monophosphatase family protein [Pandoraea bronchicola]|uniref:inositol-phosphate phosphatase n=1 Tax=Pandoraea bronchicola TaxID=2508287 RepID=A0A5E5BZU1_9BURK|nr:inositol monophosphatase [Pandoraea bronchicola]VVE90475.1 Inositol-1-monophosphatase [Pandoraea bronchicola]
MTVLDHRMTGYDAVRDVALDTRYRLAQAVAREAGLRALGMFRERDSLVVEYKGVQDVVSVADREIERLVRERVATAFPDDAFLGEESAAAGRFPKTSRVVWVVDPIDGTACFLHGMHAWCVSVAVMIDGEPVIGAVYDPNADELFHAAKGRGAFVVNARRERTAVSGHPDDEAECRDGDATTPLRVAQVTAPTEGVLGLGVSHRVDRTAFLAFVDAWLARGGMFVRIGSGALMMAYVAAGRLIGYYEPHIHAWDCLAGIVLVKEAGGRANDFLADDGLLRGNPILAAGPVLFDTLDTVVKASWRHAVDVGEGAV